MRQHELRDMIRDVDIACAIRRIVRRHALSVQATSELLTKLHVPRAGSVAELATHSA